MNAIRFLLLCIALVCAIHTAMASTTTLSPAFRRSATTTLGRRFVRALRTTTIMGGGVVNKSVNKGRGSNFVLKKTEEEMH
ncbi:hypothetical protein L596_026240 [Steinernema carpocapsae]|uniref:RxLR effector protein n=1 Tax=Steinernema carpocapsae TaxID=34508 RepID=A0A4U5M0V9_STECR|nr:hypothetical protein L596_026240 [Steinernema carpocapsae]